MSGVFTCEATCSAAEGRADNVLGGFLCRSRPVASSLVSKCVLTGGFPYCSYGYLSSNIFFSYLANSTLVLGFFERANVVSLGMMDVLA